jgi:hypothetical protein
VELDLAGRSGYVGGVRLDAPALSRVKVVKVGQQHDALLFVRVGSGDERDGFFRRARIVG